MNRIDTKCITLGSLFDGIGAIPYAASFFGIKTLWASEILPNAISVTKRHFPNMEHLGDITKVDGGRIPPVQIIGFGSPCQSWSVAGPRTSFNGKSGLFFEAIRIINEMRYATNGRSPQIVLFENVVGLLNVDSGSGYKTVLEAFCQTEIPMPESGRWASAGMVRGRGVDLAWVVKDASKHFRTPQRRKRLYLIVDYSEQRAGEILFVTKSLSGYFTARESQGQGITANAESGAGDESKSLDIAAFMAGQAKNARSIAYSESVSPTLKGSPSGLNQVPCVCEPRDIQKTTVYGICSYSSNSMLSGNPDIGFYEAETSRTLDKNCCYPANHQGGLAIVEPQIARTLTARADSSPCVDLGQNVVVMAKADIIKPENPGEGLQCVHPLIAGTLCASAAGLSRPAGMASETDLCVAYCQKNPDVTAVDCRNFKEEEGISGTLQSKSTGGYSLNFINPIRIDYIVRRLTPTEAERLMSLPDDWTKYGHDGKLMSDSARYSMCGNSIVVNVLAYIMRNIAELLYER